jgi:hypothetical protein
MERNFALDHLEFALPYARHIGGNRLVTAEIGGVVRKVAPQISFLLGMQAIFGRERPTQRRLTTAVHRPACTMCAQ